jgi:hypothetical protein
MPTNNRIVFVTGATGFVGRSLCLRLARSGWHVLALVRDPARARALLGEGPELVDSASGEAGLREALSRCQAVVHLAGAGLFDRRWSGARKAELRSSRVDLGRALVAAMAEATPRPRSLVSASAIGWYGDRGADPLDERSSAGTGFLAELCGEWERQAEAARNLGARVVSLRIGIVLGQGGGVLGKVERPFRLGLGGRLGSGRQWMSWIHLEDLLELLVRALEDERFDGPINATTSEPVTNAEFTRLLARELRRPAILPAPGFGLRLALGESASVLLGGQRVLPRRALELGFSFRFPDLPSALADLLRPREGIFIGPARDLPEAMGPARARARYLLEQNTLLAAPLDRVFDFFSRAGNLGALTPPGMEFRLRSPLPIEMRVDRRIDYTIRVARFPLAWRSRIAVWEPGARFVDEQERGPYACWWHEHAFEEQGGLTRMRDRVWFAPPGGPLAGLPQSLAIEPRLRAIFDYRARAIELRFGRPAPAQSANAPASRPVRVAHAGQARGSSR